MAQDVADQDIGTTATNASGAVHSRRWYGFSDTDISRFNMPELHWVMGYPFALALMAATALILIVYFKKKGWF